MRGHIVACLGLLFAVVRADFIQTDNSMYCVGTAQENLNLQEIRGAWYAVEVMYHREDTRHPPGVTVVDSCPTVFIEIRDSDVQMTWYENAGTLNYNFTVDQFRNPGKWVSKGPQADFDQENSWQREVPYTGTRSLVHNTPYRQFAGIVDVSKAVGTHMVLTFCSPGSDLYSVVLARHRSLPIRELRGIALMLERRQLRNYATREACRGGATSLATTGSTVVTLLTAVVMSLVKWHGST